MTTELNQRSKPIAYKSNVNKSLLEEHIVSNDKTRRKYNDTKWIKMGGVFILILVKMLNIVIFML